MYRLLTLLVLALFFGAAVVRGEEPEKDKPAPKKADDKADEAAPAPRQLPEPEIIVLPYHQRINRYDVWQKVGVAQSGFWRPRVINSPYGAYYLYNGKPYPWMPVRQTSIVAVSVGTPYRAAPTHMPYCDD